MHIYVHVAHTTRHFLLYIFLQFLSRIASLCNVHISIRKGVVYVDRLRYT
jgi:hypothetical protein